MNFGSKAIHLFFLIQCFKKKIILGKVYITGLKMLSLLICARVFKFSEKKKSDYIYVSVVTAFSWPFDPNTLKYCTAQK